MKPEDVKLEIENDALVLQGERRDEREEEKPSEKRLLSQEVTEEEIADVVAAWTGIPVSRMLETEEAKLLVMDSVAPAAK